MKTRSKVAVVLLVLLAGLVAIPVIGCVRENRQLRAERAREHSLVHVGQNLGEAQGTLRQRGYRFQSATPTEYLDYHQLLVIIGDTTPSRLDTLFYVIGGGNPLRTESSYVVMAASPDGVITAIE